MTGNQANLENQQMPGNPRLGFSRIAGPRKAIKREEIRRYEP